MINLTFYRHNLKLPHTGINANKIPYNELTVVFKGRLCYTVNGVDVPLEKGDIIYIPKDNLRQRAPVSDAEYISFNFKTDTPVHLPLSMKDGMSEIVYNLLHVFDSIFQYTNNLQDERFELILSCLLKQLQKQYELQSEPLLVAKIKNYIRLNFSHKITLADISMDTHYSIPHCEMVFKQTTGMSIARYIIKKRIDESKSLLQEGTLSLPEIADEVGFSDYNYFSRAFKKEVGITPHRYKNSYYL